MRVIFGNVSLLANLMNITFNKRRKYWYLNNVFVYFEFYLNRDCSSKYWSLIVLFLCNFSSFETKIVHRISYVSNCFFKKKSLQFLYEMRHDILIHELFIRLSYFITWVRSKTMQEDGTVNNRRNNKWTSFVSLSNVILLKW